MDVPKWEEPYFYLEKCIKFWEQLNCRGNYISKEKMKMMKSVSGCSACKRKNQTGGLLCIGTKQDHKCVRLPSICEGGLTNETSENKEIETRNVPIIIEPLDIHNFVVFNPSTRGKQELPSVAYIVYRRPNTRQGFDPDTVEFRPNEKVLLYIHSYATPFLDDGLNIKDAVFEGTLDVDSVILVDWRKWSLCKF